MKQNIDSFYIPKEKWDELKEKGLLEIDDTQNVTDWELKSYEGVNDAKYKSYMYSPSLDRLRKPSIIEFYGGGIID